MAPKIGTTADDLQHRSKQIHWPKSFDPVEVQSFAHNELLVHTDCSKVWEHLVDIPRWPAWLSITKDVKYLNGATTLAQGTRFQWTMLSYPEESRTEEFVANSRLGWYSYTRGSRPCIITPGYSNPRRTVVASRQRRSDSDPMPRSRPRQATQKPIAPTTSGWLRFDGFPAADLFCPRQS